MTIALLIDGADAQSTYGFTLATPQGWRDMPQIQRQTENVPGRAGALLVGLQQEQPRTLKLSGTVQGSSNADTRAKIDALTAALAYPGGVSLIFGDRPTVEYGAVLNGLTITTPPQGALIATKLPVDIEMVCLRPYAEDLCNTSIDLTTVAVALPLGTAPVLPALTLIAGAALTNPTFTLYDSQGNIIATSTLTVAMVAGDILAIDCDAGTITLNGNSHLEYLTAGDFLLLDVASQGQYALGSWPTLKVTTATGATWTATVAYKKAWLS